jgi:D-lactate dehydrogenase
LKQGRPHHAVDATQVDTCAHSICADPLHLLAYGSDASFYRLLPKAVIKVHGEGEVQGLLRLSQAHQVPVTFRAAGTSLSGQA